MNFKEKYINEMESVKPYYDLDVPLLRAINRKEMTVEKNKRDKRYKELIAVAAVFGIIIIGANFNSIKTFASKIFGNYTLNAGGEKMDFDEIKPVTFDEEKFISSDGVNISCLSDSEEYKTYWKEYTDVNTLKDETGLEIVGF